MPEARLKLVYAANDCAPPTGGRVYRARVPSAHARRACTRVFRNQLASVSFLPTPVPFVTVALDEENSTGSSSSSYDVHRRKALSEGVVASRDENRINTRHVAECGETANLIATINAKTSRGRER